jgi:hypothetical protein
MKAIAIEELEPISPLVHAEAVKAGCTHVRVSEPIWRGPAHKGVEGEEMRMVEFSWFKAILVKDTVVFDETEPEKFLAVLEEYGLGDVESMQPRQRREAKREDRSEGNGSAPVVSMPIPAAPATQPERQAITVYVLEATKAKMEQQANQAGLSAGGLLDRIFGGNSA